MAYDTPSNNQRQYLPFIWFEDISHISLNSEELCKRQDVLEVLESSACLNDTEAQSHDNTKHRHHGPELGYFKSEDAKTSIQHEVLASGKVRFWSISEDYEQLREIFEVEQNADVRHYTIYKTAEPETVPVDEFNIIEGEVYDVFERGDNIYINFGEDWRSDFTLRIRRYNYVSLKKQTGLDILNLKGKTLNIRGITYDYNGPAIDWTLPTQVFIKTSDQ